MVEFWVKIKKHVLVDFDGFKLKLFNFLSDLRIILLVIFLMTLCLDAKSFFGERLLISDWIYWMTFLVLVWYANETQRLREVEQTPILDLYFREGKGLDIRNSGKGAAYNVIVDEIKYAGDEFIGIGGCMEFEFYFKDPSLILRSDGVGGVSERPLCVLVKYKNDLTAGGYVEGDQARDKFLRYVEFQSGLKRKKVVMIIKYKNYLGRKFERAFHVYHRALLCLDGKYIKSFEIELLK